MKKGAAPVHHAGIIESVGATFTSYYFPGVQKEYQTSGWAKEVVDSAAQLGIIPDSVEKAHDNDLRGDITRGELAAIMVKVYETLHNKTVPVPSTNPFKDVAKDDPNYEYILKVNSLKIATGDEYGFRPNSNITRAEMSAMIYRLVTGDVNDSQASQYADHGSRFSDVDSGDWFSGYVGYCAKEGYVNGVGNDRFEPYEQATVEQALKIAVEILNDLK